MAAECERRGAARTVCKEADLSVSGAGATIVRDCLGAIGGLEVAICNAGYGIIGPVLEVPPADMSRIWQVNFQSAYETIHAALPHLLGQKRGHIVMVSSVLGKKAMPFSASYSVTKFAQVALGEALWGELRGSGVGVSVICPGFTATEFHQGNDTVSIAECEGQVIPAVRGWTIQLSHRSASRPTPDPSGRQPRG